MGLELNIDSSFKIERGVELKPLNHLEWSRGHFGTRENLGNYWKDIS